MRRVDLRVRKIHPASILYSQPSVEKLKPTTVGEISARDLTFRNVEFALSINYNGVCKLDTLCDSHDGRVCDMPHTLTAHCRHPVEPQSRIGGVDEAPDQAPLGLVLDQQASRIDA